MKVAVVGATGLVGTKMLQVLAERNFPVTEIVPVASERSVGKEVEFKGKAYKVVSMADGIAAKPAVAGIAATASGQAATTAGFAVATHWPASGGDFESLFRAPAAGAISLNDNPHCTSSSTTASLLPPKAPNTR